MELVRTEYFEDWLASCGVLGPNEFQWREGRAKKKSLSNLNEEEVAHHFLLCILKRLVKNYFLTKEMFNI